MERTVQIGDKNVKLNNNIGWALVYRDQFGTDIIPILMPLFASAMDVVNGLIVETGKVDKVTIEDIAKVTDGDYLLNAIIHLGGLELTDFIKIIWALAKSADETIPEMEEWVKGFDEFPLDVLIPEVTKLVLKGVVSSKNLTRLMTLKEKLQKIQPSNSTPSSSQESKED